MNLAGAGPPPRASVTVRNISRVSTVANEDAADSCRNKKDINQKNVESKLTPASIRTRMLHVIPESEEVSENTSAG